MDAMKHRRLQEMDRSDFEIVKGEPDIRGWDVRNGAGLRIGEVEELIVDAQKQKVRYMVVELDDDELKLKDDKKVLIPIGLAELDKDDDDVILPTVTVDQLAALPVYDKDHLDDEVEQRVCTALGRTDERAGTILQSTSPTTHTERSTRQTESPAMQPASTPPQKDHTARSHAQQPSIGTAEYYGNFYQHAFFNDYNLYKNRQQKAAASASKEDPEYERGLRLWELRSEGGILPDDRTTQGEREREMNEERRLEMVRNRRRSYEDRRGYSHRDEHRDDRHNDDHHHRRDNSIIGRIRDEGLQDG